MEITDELVNKVAKLARLHVAENKREQMKQDLQKMVSFVEKLNEVDTNGVDPLLHISSNVNVLRADKVVADFSHQDALKNAPATDGVFFNVPKVINKNQESR